jgi:hypothetical protein
MRNAALTALKTAPGAALWPTPKIHLSQDPAYSPGPTDTNATLAVHECTFTGYVAQVPTFVVPVNVGATTEALISTVVFQSTGSAITNQVYGYWGDDGTNLFLAEAFGAVGPFQVAISGDYVQIDVILPINVVQTAL